MMGSKYVLLIGFSLFGLVFIITNGDIVIQSDQHCGSNMSPKEERIKDVSEFTINSHIGRQYYYPARDCVVAILGENNYQWEVELQNIDIDGHKCKHEEPCCNDYLKLFNAYTVDNARLFPSIPWRGICGTGLPKKILFTSTQNYITIQFNSDHLAESMRGFQLKMRQVPRRSAGSDYYATGFFGGWNDGSLNELQIDWKEQQLVPGDFKPGKDPTFEKDPNGVSCYLCTGCKRDYFKTSEIGVTKEDGCYVCSKEWLQGTAKAQRNCMSKTMFENKLLALRDVSTGLEATTDFRSCRVFSTTSSSSSSSTNYINLCICDSNNCNHAALLKPSFVTGVLVIFLMVLLKMR